MKLTKVQFEALQPYEKQLHTAYYGGFIRNASSLLIEIVEQISKKLINNPRFRIKKGCPACVLDAIVKIAPFYFEVKEEYTKPPVVEDNALNELKEAKEEVFELEEGKVIEKPKVGRPKGSKNKVKEDK